MFLDRRREISLFLTVCRLAAELSTVIAVGGGRPHRLSPQIRDSMLLRGVARLLRCQLYSANAATVSD
jgi:hypothetical protein